MLLSKISQDTSMSMVRIVPSEESVNQPAIESPLDKLINLLYPQTVPLNISNLL